MMTTSFADTESGGTRGRPREVVLNEGEAAHLGRLYLKSNATRKSGSARLAWAVFCEERPEWAWTLEGKSSKHNIPLAAREVCRKAKGLVGLHRGGSRWLRTDGPCNHGTMRRHWDEERRLYGGEQFSHDDGTINLGVWIPWPWGGDKCSDKWGAMVGRFQLLLTHDDATSFIPAWSYVVRPAQGYRGPETAGHLLRVERDICIPGRHVIEGGVWQGKRVLAVLGNRWVDAKGRPRMKMVENYFNRLWSRLSVELPGQVGRWRGEMREEGLTYMRCRQGRADPRKHYVGIENLLSGMETSINWLNADRVESKRFGKWVPEERWETDMKAHPRGCRAEGEEWLAAPAAAERTVRRGSVHVTEAGPYGMRMEYVFQSAELWQWEGRRVNVYFDPLDGWPITAAVVRDGKKIADAECANPVGDEAGRDVAAAIRQAMRREYRAIWKKETRDQKPETRDKTGAERQGAERQGVRESEMRGPGGVAEVRNDFGRGGVDRPAGSGEREASYLQDHEARLNGAGRKGAAGGALCGSPLGGATDGGAEAGTRRSLRGRAAAAREHEANW